MILKNKKNITTKYVDKLVIIEEQQNELLKEDIEEINKIIPNIFRDEKKVEEKILETFINKLMNILNIIKELDPEDLDTNMDIIKKLVFYLFCRRYILYKQIMRHMPDFSNEEKKDSNEDTKEHSDNIRDNNNVNSLISNYLFH